jgi:hypothetical protein
MRKIEEQMLHAIRTGADWKSGNTSVDWSHNAATFGGSCAVVRLHGNRIGIYHPGSGALTLEDGEGWRTSTTKSRLNALVDLVPCRCGVYQHRGEWRFQRSDGTSEAVGRLPCCGVRCLLRTVERVTLDGSDPTCYTCTVRPTLRLTT